jgi:hypothetical protein
MLGVIGFAATAQTGFTVGARLGPGFAFNEMEGYFNLIKNAGFDDNSNIAFAMAVYGNYTISPKFSVQVELDLMVNNGAKLSGYDIEMKGSFTSLDLPVLARYEFFEAPVSFSMLGGPYLTFPIGKFKAKLTDPSNVLGVGNISENVDIDGIRLGITVGLAAGYKLGPGSIIADLRFLKDLAPVKIEASGIATEVFTRRGINLTVGYEMKF